MANQTVVDECSMLYVSADHNWLATEVTDDKGCGVCFTMASYEVPTISTLHSTTSRRQGKKHPCQQTLQCKGR